jgi:hypothetical protein
MLFATPAGAYLNGSNILIDGGWSMVGGSAVAGLTTERFRQGCLKTRVLLSGLSSGLSIGNMHMSYSILPRCSIHHLPSTFAASTTGPSPLKMRAFSSISSTSSSSWCMDEY